MGAKYLGLIDGPDNLVTKDYVDKKTGEIKEAGYITKDTADGAYQAKGEYATKEYVNKSKIDSDGYVRFNAANLLFSSMLFAKIEKTKIRYITELWGEMLVNVDGRFVKISARHNTSNRIDILTLIKKERYLYVPNDMVFQFFDFLENQIMQVSW